MASKRLIFHLFSRNKTWQHIAKRANVTRNHCNTRSGANLIKNSNVPLLAAVTLIPTVSAFGFGRKKQEPAQEAPVAPGLSPEEAIIRDADALYDDNAIQALYDLLSAQRESDNDEIIWRLARASCEMGKGAADKEKKKAYTYEAYDHIQRALSLNDRNFAVHKWYAILLDYIGEYEGTKARITNAYKVKEHLSRAIELNPKDATTIHSLGYWCFMVADLPWYQQKVASVIFATPPTSSFDEALKNFLEAEKIDPDFYSMNLVMIGKTYLRLGNKSDARPYLERARDYVIKTEDDKKAHKEALELLAGLE